MFSESHPNHLKIWNDVKDHYLLEILDQALNTIPESDKPISDYSEKEFDDWLTKQNFSEKRKQEYDIRVPKLQMESNPHCEKSDTLILPLSLENNATTTGTAAIIEEFGKEFGVPCEHAKEYLPFDDTNKVFNIEAARKHHLFLASLKEHKKEMAETIRILKNAEKEFKLNLAEENDNDDLKLVNFTESNKQKVNAKFENVFKNMMKRMWEAQQGDEDGFLNFIGWLNSHRNVWENVKDFNGRTLIHAAVENGNLSMVKTLVYAGVNINAKERCGATALTIAVLKKNEEICKFLLDNFAIFNDYFFPTIPSPHIIARKLELGVADLMDEKSKAEIATNIELWTTVQNTEEVEPDSVSEESDTNNEEYQYERKSSLTLFVGDQGTNKVLRGVKGRSAAAYGWCAEVPGDMHAKGYCYEVCKKVMAPGGLMHILREVLLRKKITPESFGKKKFQEQNLKRIEEAIRDTSAAFGIAASIEFRKSASFPNQDELKSCKRTTGNHNEILISKFKEWISSNKQDAYFQYYSQMFTLFGPLQQMYINAIKYGDGFAREAVLMIMHPLFAQSNKRNYYTEAMVHILNLTVIWPLSTRELLKQNSSISLSGTVGRNIALDEWVEMCIVQPMKNYSTGKVPPLNFVFLGL